jgi:hypothetical protein
MNLLRARRCSRRDDAALEHLARCPSRVGRRQLARRHLGNYAPRYLACVVGSSGRRLRLKTGGAQSRDQLVLQASMAQAKALQLSPEVDDTQPARTLEVGELLQGKAGRHRAGFHLAYAQPALGLTKLSSFHLASIEYPGVPLQVLSDCQTSHTKDVILFTAVHKM